MKDFQDLLGKETSNSGSKARQDFQNLQNQIVSKPAGEDDDFENELENQIEASLFQEAD